MLSLSLSLYSPLQASSTALLLPPLGSSYLSTSIYLSIYVVMVVTHHHPSSSLPSSCRPCFEPCQSGEFSPGQLLRSPCALYISLYIYIYPIALSSILCRRPVSTSILFYHYRVLSPPFCSPGQASSTALLPLLSIVLRLTHFWVLLHQLIGVLPENTINPVVSRHHPPSSCRTNADAAARPSLRLQYRLQPATCATDCSMSCSISHGR